MGRRRGRHPFLKLLLVLALVAGGLLADSNLRLVTTEYRLSYERLPRAFDGFRIAQLSDVHAAQFGENNARLIEAVEKTDPDIIAITGDLIDADDQLGIIEPLVLALADIAPVYYVTGNHEWDSGGLKELLALLDAAGVTVLRNDYVMLSRGGQALALAGLDDPNGPADMIKPDELIAQIRAARGDVFLVALAHRNRRLPVFSSGEVDLALCGHAHGGIIRLPFTDGLIGPNREWMPSYTNGLYAEAGGADMIVSRGVGNHTGYPRFLNNPHIPVIVLQSG